jgi:hypothetical protein
MKHSDLFGFLYKKSNKAVLNSYNSLIPNSKKEFKYYFLILIIFAYFLKHKKFIIKELHHWKASNRCTYTNALPPYPHQNTPFPKNILDSL